MLVILIIIGCLIECYFYIKEGACIGIWLILIVFSYIIFASLLSTVVKYDYIKSKENIEILKIVQNMEGKYLVITKDYDKIESLNIILVGAESKLEKQLISQTKFDGFIMDKIEYKLYLNLNDVERGW